MDIIEGYQKSGLVSDRPWYNGFCCGDCILFTSEECNGIANEGSERFEDSLACEEYEKKTW